MRYRKSCWPCILAVLLVSACGAGVDRSIALVTSPRILAVRAEPPECAPGVAVTYTALAATPDGAEADAGIDWSFCSSPAQATQGSDVSSVSSACLVAPGDPAATGNGVSLITPANACRAFGPLGMPTPSGKSALRPTPADASGGYNQPVRLDWGGALAFAFERLTCSPTGVSLDLAQAYRDARTPNRNPRLLSLTGELAGAAVDPGLVPSVSAGAMVALTAAWAADSAETYVDLDPEQATLVDRTESLWLAWFTSGGELDRDFSIPSDGDTAATVRWRAPDRAGSYHLWAVLHDSRGGGDFAEAAFVVAAE